MGDVKTVIGMMSGTSLDGVDAALLRTDGEGVLEPVEAISLPYAPATRAKLQKAVKAALEDRLGAIEVGVAGEELTRVHIAAVEALLEKAGLDAADVDLIGFHGQTVLHQPAATPGEAGRTVQIGSGALLARETGVDVVEDFRGADVAAGGEGAPFAPVYHAALARGLETEGAIAALNLGGVANITFIPASRDENDIIAFDCGPGNGLIDQWVELKTGAAMDKDGAFAREGTVHPDRLRQMLAHPYFTRPIPKSLDRYDFSLDAVLDLSLPDGAATLTAFSAAAVAVGARALPEAPKVWIACGGGRRNPALMEALNAGLEGRVKTAEEVGWRGDDIESECFGYLAVRSVYGFPLSFPKTTRVPKPMTGGVLRRVLA